MTSPISTTKQVQNNFLTFIQSYKNLFNTTYSTLQSQPNLPVQSPQSIQLKQQLVAQLYQTYRNVITSIDSLQQINFQDTTKRPQKIIIEDDESERNSMTYVGNQQVSGQNLLKQQQKHQLYEKQICEEHDNAVKRYKQAIKTAEIWREHLYKYINENMPSGNH